MSERMIAGAQHSGSEDSLRLVHLARCLMESCPVQLAEEIAVTGSVSRGLADEFSDIEIICWSDELAPVDEWSSWLRSVGVTDLVIDTEPEPDGSCWITCRSGDSWIELGWNSFRAVDEVIDGIMSGERSGHLSLATASMLSYALTSTSPIADR